MKKLGFGLMRLPITEEGNPIGINQELLIVPLLKSA